MHRASPLPQPTPFCIPQRLLATARRPKRGVEGSMDMQIGAHVRIHRERLGLSMSELARVSGLSLSMLSRVERGLVSPSIQALARIASALRVSMAELLEDVSPKQRADAGPVGATLQSRSVERARPDDVGVPCGDDSVGTRLA